MKIVIIGAGSPYSPEIIKELAQRRDRLPVSSVALVDINAQRLQVMGAFLSRYAESMGLKGLTFTSHAGWGDALPGADYVITQFRIGGNQARARDERIALKHGFIGQETTGVGGMMKALRTIPVAVELGRAMADLCPRAWMINYTNPSGMVAEGVSRYGNPRVVGMCAGGIRPAQEMARAAGVQPADVRYDYFGLNHLSFAYNFTIKGEPAESGVVAKALASREEEAGTEMLRALGMFPSSYLQYYFRRGKRYQEILNAPMTRGEVVQRLEKTIYDAYGDPARCEPPQELYQRGGGGYSQVALDVLESLYTGRERWMVCNVANAGTVACLPHDAFIETACMVGWSGIRPLPQPRFPRQVWGLISAVKNYEQLTIEAAMTGERSTLLMAMAAHPLIGDVDRALPLMQDMLEASREHLPAFFAKGA